MVFHVRAEQWRPRGEAYRNMFIVGTPTPCDDDYTRDLWVERVWDEDWYDR